MRCVAAAAADRARCERARLGPCSSPWGWRCGRGGCGGGAGGCLRRGVLAGGSALLRAPVAARHRHRGGFPAPPELAAHRQHQSASPGENVSGGSDFGLVSG